MEMSNKLFKSLLPALLVVLMLGFNLSSSAQDWYHSRKAGIYSVGLGGAEGIAVGGNTYAGYYGVNRLSGLALSLNVSGEYMVHKYIGVGFETGLNFGLAGYYGYKTMEIPLIAKANFHILEVTSASIKDKLDVYAGLSFGGGPAFYLNSGSGANVFGIIHVGPQGGVRYWFSDKLAVFGEVGWGATFINGGLSF